VVTRTGSGPRLKHDHRQADGSEDALTQYGGDTLAAGTAERQEFPADQFSKDMFVRQIRAVSVPNVWAMEVQPARTFAYELRRPGRFFASNSTSPNRSPRHSRLGEVNCLSSMINLRRNKHSFSHLGISDESGLSSTLHIAPTKPP
jgi:hypothetical protein